MTQKSASLSKKEKTLAYIHNLSQTDLDLACIRCGQMIALQDQSLLCPNGHRFDIARQGYFYLTSVHQDSKYQHDLWTARRTIIQEYGLFESAMSEIKQIILNFCEKLGQPPTIIDAGMGEGSHLAQILPTLPAHSHVYGLDLSRQGVQLATDYVGDFLPLVADISHLPFKDDSCHIILSILSPANYDEFKRIAASQAGAILLKLIPNPDYLKEIRHELTLIRGKDYESYDNQAVIDIFREHFREGQSQKIQAELDLTPPMAQALITMTPLTWDLAPEEQAELLNRLLDKGTVTLSWTLLTADL